MNQSSHITGSNLCKRFVFLLVICAVMMIVPMGYGQDNAQNFVFNGKNGISANVRAGKQPAPFTAELGRKLADGIEVTAAGSQYPVKFIPITMTQGVGTRRGNSITYAIAPGVHIIYANKNNGVKEDIVFDNPLSAPSQLAFRLELDPILDARLDKKGNILIYGPNSILSGFIQTGDAKSAELILKARRNATKDNLLYIIPAPVVIDGQGRKHKNIAYYELEKSILTLHSGAITELPAPVSIDPSIVITTTADFMTGNNEGMISFDTDAISRAIPTGWGVAAWTATTSFITARYYHTSLVYNGYLYVIGGYNGTTFFNDVQFAPINGDGTIGAWTSTTSFTTARYAHTSVAYNGYLYVIGGRNGSTYYNDVQFAPINANGTVGAWTVTSSFTTARYRHTSVAYNGYLYVIGGYDGTTFFNDVQFAPINGDGTIGAWTATTSFTTARYGHTSVAYNGYLYVIGGESGPTYLNDVQFAPINADGTVGAWAATNDFTTAREGHTSVAYNGYLYVIGGESGSTNYNDVQCSPINVNGTVGIWATTNNLSTGRWGHALVAFNGFLYVIGGLGGSYHNDVQYARITLASAKGSVFTWNPTTSFTTGRQTHASVAYNGYVYVIGGDPGAGSLNDVQYAPIYADGTIGTWTATTSFTTARFSHTSVVYNGYLYVIGGYSGSYLNDVQYAPINANGTVGAWTATNSFATARYGHASVAYNGYLYVIGGYSGSNLNDVQYAPINANGTIGAWTTTTSFTTGRYYHKSVANNGYLYILGGNAGGYFNDVQYAPINANGTIGAWTATTSFTTARYGHTSVAYNGYLYILGGWSGTVMLNDVQYAPIKGDGTVGTWATTASFTTARYQHTSIAYNGCLFVLGGHSVSYLNDVQYAQINNASGAVSTWTATTSFTTARAHHSSVAYNGHLYILGGWTGSTFLNDVQYAPINGDGTVGTWTTATSFASARSNHTSVVYNGYLYVIGGWNGVTLNDVQYAPISANGWVGTWTATTSFATARSSHASVAYNGYLYILGGWSPGPTYFNNVQYAPINADGTVGIWTATTSLTAAREDHTSVAYNGYLYVIGGANATSYFNDVQFASINANGTIGSWTATTSFDTNRSLHTSVAHNGYLYIIGGTRASGAYLNDVQFAPINSNGTVGTWTSTNSFNTPRHGHTSAVYSNYLYILGGDNGTTYYNDVQVSTFDAIPALRGYYSKLIDIGTNQIINSISFSGSATNGITNLTYAIAPSSTAVFGTRTTIPGAVSGALYTTGLGTCARYAWVRFELDDTGVAEEDAKRDLLDFTLNYSSFSSSVSSLLASKSSPNVHLSWSTSPGATSYNVLRCTAATIPCTPVTIATPVTTSWNDPVLADSNNYWYLIQATSGECMSGVVPAR